MSLLTIDIQDMNTSFQPGQTIRGQVQWQLDKEPQNAIGRLLWYTVGIGTEDVGVVRTVIFDNPVATDTRQFDFTLPVGPYSFSGMLISLIWTLELEVDKECMRQDITLSPSGKEVKLYPETVA